MTANQRFERLGKYFKTKRIEKGLSQVEVAKRLNFSTSQMVSNWERGLCSPPLSSLPKIMKLYGLSKVEVVELMTNEYRREIENLFKKGKAV